MQQNARRTWWEARTWLSLSAVLFVTACEGAETTGPAPGSWEGLCIDLDQDGRGFQCADGPDCDDGDPSVFEGCDGCSEGRAGCACEPSAPPATCTLPRKIESDGSLLCSVGTRYCRDGAWSECEGVRSFTAPPPARFHERGLLDPDAGAVVCDPCHPDCYRVEDALEIVDDAGMPLGDNVIHGPGGGITLASEALDGGTSEPPLLDDATCTPGTAPDVDCDGIPDEFDPYPYQPPFASDHNTIFMDLPPGASGQQLFEVQFYLNTADIYFYLDMTASMDQERDNLIASLTSGNFLENGGADTECADRDFDGTANNELKNQGIAGNIACLIRDSQLGTGWFRDIPFPGPYANGITVAPYDFEMFEHRQDITSDVSQVLTALSGFQTRGNYNQPEGSMQGLWSLVTGQELYAGWDRPGIPARLDCPSGTWGYPCFRNDAVPIVVHITDAPMQNGPGTSSNRLSAYPYNPVDYDENVLRWMSSGTDGFYRSLSSSAETFESSEFVGTVENGLITYTGDTSKMTSDLKYEQVGSCPANQSAWHATDEGSPDAVFRFQVENTSTIRLSSRGTRFDSTLMLLRADAPLVSSTQDVSGNATVANVADLGTLSVGAHVLARGNFGTHSTAFTRESLACLSGTGADDRERGAVFKFRVAEDMPLRIGTVSSGTNFTIATSLLEGNALEPTDISLTGMSCAGAPGVVDGNCNDGFGDYDVGDLVGRSLRFTNGDTRDGSINPDFPADGFAAAGCSGVSGTSDDVVYDFSVSQPTRVRIETSGNNSNLQAGFSHALALIERPATIQPTMYSPSGNDDVSTADAAHDAEIFESEVRALPEGGWVQYAGNSAGATADYEQAEVGGTTSGVCNNGNVGGATSARDVVFKFEVTETQSYDFDTMPTQPESGYKTWLSLHAGQIDTQITRNMANIPALDDAQGAPALTVEEGSLDGRQVVLQRGQMDQRNASIAPSVMGCGSTSGNALGGRDAVFRFRVASDRLVTLASIKNTGTAASRGAPSFDSYMAVFRDSISAGNRVTSACSNPSGNGYAINGLPVQGGRDYFVVVKQWAWSSSLTSSSGAFGLYLADDDHASSFLACDAGSHPNSSTYSKLTRVLTPGVYYIVVKGPVAGSYYDYQLNVRKTPVTPPIMACANDDNRRAVIERDLTPGNYSVVLRGKTVNDRNTYTLSMRDLSAAPVPTACHNGQQGTSSFLRELKASDENGAPIDYYLVVRGNTSAGAYRLSLDDVRSATLACSDDDTWAVGDQGQALDDAEITTTLDPGEYVAVLKGYRPGNKGLFQLTVGNPNLAQSGRFGAKSWLGPNGDGTGGIRDALLERGVRVITVRSSSDSYTREQSDTLARATGALSVANTPLSFSIGSDGSGMGSAVIDAVSLLAGNLAMDVGVVLVEQPDNPSPNFRFSVEAIDVAGDSCDAPIDTDLDAEHLPDTHRNCRPGATPRFQVTFRNPPPPNHVPPNANDPKGGYSMKLQLIGDGTYVVDQIPVYIIPEDVVEDPPTERFATQGSYEQIVDSTGCTGAETPRWRSLYWNATVPGGTKLTWQLCAGNTDAELAACTNFTTAAVVQSGGPCTTASDCEQGYCDPSGVCHYAVGASCTTADQCGVGGSCVTNTCVWDRNPIDLRPALAATGQGRKKMRVRVVLESNGTRSAAPTIHDWRLDYVCGANE